MRKQQIRKITANIVLFLKAFAIVVTKVVKQIVLPNRRRKGNLLSSLLLFFIYLNDLIITFSWGFSIRFILRWKHYDRAVSLAKHALLFTGCALFLLSSFEWSYPEGQQLTSTDSVIQSGLDIYNSTQGRTMQYHAVAFKIVTPSWNRKIITICITTYTPTLHIASNIYVRNCSFRI